MIYTDRNRKDENGNPIKPSKNWYRKAKNNLKLIVQARLENRTPKFEASIYADPIEIRPLIEKLFYGKCAYCEVKPIRNDWDVEHFRPKGRVNEEKEHPGYFWLVYDWNNLYMGCQYCNQARRDSPKSKALGKKDQFPLEIGSLRANGPGFDLQLEKRLLIDPCQDNPEVYLTFTIDGKPIPIDNNLKALKSIEVFHLDMAKANRARKRKIEEYMWLYGLLVDAVKASLEDPDVLFIKEAIEKYSKKMESMTFDEEEFAAVARSIRKRPAAYGIPANQVELFNMVTHG